ncbi:MAG: inositol monophosphatase [Planctomycetota bacterium]|nr:MAG: inositol monophosphatase [Planctomycetota bacterium]
MNDGERRACLEWCVDLARRVGRTILLPRLQIGRPPAGLRKKGIRDLVTEADELAERTIVAEIGMRYPEHHIVAEETRHDESQATGWRWYVDPLDGTTNFVHGLPLFCVSIALYGPEGGEVAVVFNPAIDECFYAARGQGAHFNSDTIRLHVSDTAELIDATVVTGFAYDQQRFPNLAAWNRLMPRTRALRRLGSAALDLAYVAAGRFDGMWEPGLNPWDVAAGALLVQEAGGRVTGYREGEDWLHGRRLLATNGALHEVLGAEVRAAEMESI